MQKKTKQDEQFLIKGKIESQNYDDFSHLTADEIAEKIKPYQTHLKNLDITDTQKLALVESIRLMVNILFDQFFEINELFFIEKNHQNKVDCNVQNAKIQITKARKIEESKG